MAQRRRAAHPYLGLHHGHQPGLLAGRRVPAPACAFARTAIADGMPGAMRSTAHHRAKQAPSSAQERSRGSVPSRPSVTVSPPVHPRSQRPGVHPDPGHHAERPQCDGEGSLGGDRGTLRGDGGSPPRGDVLAQRLLGHGHAADALGEAGRGDQHLQIGPPVLRRRRNPGRGQPRRGRGGGLIGVQDALAWRHQGGRGRCHESHPAPPSDPGTFRPAGSGAHPPAVVISGQREEEVRATFYAPARGFTPLVPPRLRGFPRGRGGRSYRDASRTRGDHARQAHAPAPQRRGGEPGAR